MGSREAHDERAKSAVLALDSLDVTVVDDRAVIDQDDSPAKPLDVCQVVSRQHDRRSALAH